MHIDLRIEGQRAVLWKALREFGLFDVGLESGPREVVGRLRAGIKASWLKPLEHTALLSG